MGCSGLLGVSVWRRGGREGKGTAFCRYCGYESCCWSEDWDGIAWGWVSAEGRRCVIEPGCESAVLRMSVVDWRKESESGDRV